MKVIKHPASGFTLMELLIALAVFSILSVMAYSGLQIVLDSKVHTEQQADRLVEIQRTFTILQRDIEQAVGRSIRDSFGDVQPAMRGNLFGTVPLEFTRAGKRNPMKRARSSMERVMYRLEEEKLDRLSLEMLDQPNVVEPLERHLLNDVKTLKFRYLDSALQWQESWPPEFGKDADPTAMPRGVELTLEIVGMGEIKRLFRVAPGEYVREPAKQQAPANQQSSGSGSGSGSSSNGANGGGNSTDSGSNSESGDDNSGSDGNQEN